MKKIIEVDCTALPSLVTDAFDAVVGELCRDTGLYPKDAYVEYCFVEDRGEYNLGARVESLALEAGPTDEWYFIWNSTWIDIGDVGWEDN